MANKGSFVPGDPRAGRPKGSPNKTARKARLLAQSLVSDPVYVEGLRQRLLDGRLSDAMEKTLWQYAFGAPPDYPISVWDDFLEVSPPYTPPDEV